MDSDKIHESLFKILILFLMIAIIGLTIIRYQEDQDSKLEKSLEREACQETCGGVHYFYSSQSHTCTCPSTPVQNKEVMIK